MIIQVIFLFLLLLLNDYNDYIIEFLPYIVPDKRDNKKVHCKLTQRTLNKIPEEIKKHVKGKKFLRLKKEYEDRKNNKNKDANNDNDDEDVDFWVPPDDDEADNDDINPIKKVKKSHEDDDKDENMDLDEAEIPEYHNNKKAIKYDDVMDCKINKDDEDYDLQFYIRKDKQNNKKGRKKQ